MARSKPPPVRLCDLTPGQHADFFALLAERTRGETRDGKPFFSCRFRDARRTATLMVWSDSDWYEACERDWRPGQFFKVRGVYGSHERYGPQIDVQNIRPVQPADEADGFRAADFVAHSRFDPEAMFAELRGLAEARIADVPLRRLVLTLLDRHAEPIKRLPATTRHAYPFAGGLLEHTLSLTRTCAALADHYAAQYPDLRPPLNRDVVVAGAALHDLGRVPEFGGDPAAVDRTVPGRLAGPILLGRDLIRDAARELGDVNPELLQLVEHVVVAHLNLLERDSPRQPLIPECLIVHHADALDTFMEMYVRCLDRDREPGPFTARDPVLNRQLFKGRSV
jgi:3'-5' exoribonuclease